MLKIKQIFAFCGKNGCVIDDRLNEFIQTLPQKGDEITNITYVMSHEYEASVHAAIIEYKE